jgi:hypothetical protein
LTGQLLPPEEEEQGKEELSTGFGLYFVSTQPGSSLGVSRVWVGETEISSEGGRGVAHSPQNFVSEGFSKLHLGHFIPVFPLFPGCKKNHN